jgi:dienelactone hydrolase
MVDLSRVPASVIAALWLAVSARASAADLASREQLLTVAATDSAGETVSLPARLCRPAGESPARLVLINHGSPPNSAARPRMELGRCDQEAARWFLDKGYVVAFVLRRGYGAAGGGWAETYGRCEDPDFVRAGIETARDIDAAVTALTALPYVRPDGAVVVGQSAGGWGTIAYDSLPHPQVAAFVVMAGGRGGHKDELPNHNCRPDRLADAAGHFGRTATTPMLWVYTANDSYFAPAIATTLYENFTAAGGKADLQRPGPYGEDGHRLFFGPGGSAIWGPLVATYLQERAAPP